MSITLRELVDVISGSINQVYRPRNLSEKFYSVTNIIYNTDSKFKDDVGGLAILTKDEHLFTVIVAKVK
jgi:hypothetical protein